jgi:hypothetical protein
VRRTAQAGDLDGRRPPPTAAARYPARIEASRTPAGRRARRTRSVHQAWPQDIPTDRPRANPGRAAGATHAVRPRSLAAGHPDGSTAREPRRPDVGGLDESTWDNEHDLRFDIELQRLQCAFLGGQLDGIDERLERLLARSRSRAERKVVYRLGIQVEAPAGRHARRHFTAVIVSSPSSLTKIQVPALRGMRDRGWTRRLGDFPSSRRCRGAGRRAHASMEWGPGRAFPRDVPAPPSVEPKRAAEPGAPRSPRPCPSRPPPSEGQAEAIPIPSRMTSPRARPALKNQGLAAHRVDARSVSPYSPLSRARSDRHGQR